jgi:D-amino-acid dehydrogenase
MNILIARQLPENLETLLVNDNIIYRPDLAIKNQECLRTALIRNVPDALITNEIPAHSTLCGWRQAMKGRRNLTVIHITDQDLAAFRLPEIGGIFYYRIDPRNSACADEDALLMAETAGRRSVATGVPIGRRDAAANCGRGRDVTLVGGGIVNLITAYYLIKAGYSVTVLERASDPALDGDWRRQGCTYAGGDARIFSLNEGRHHHFKDLTVTPATNTQFDRVLRDGGWLVNPVTAYDGQSRKWIDEFHTVPPWLAKRFNQDIIGFNQESAWLWREMMADAPELFRGVGFHDGLLRLYPTDAHYGKALAAEGEIGAIIREIDMRRLPVEFPSLHEAWEAGAIGGALEVVGFSVNVHRFAETLRNYLAAQGCRICWNAEVDKILRDREGRVIALEMSDNTVVMSSHYVISPGAFGNEILTGFRSEGKVAAVAGMWLALPDDKDRPLDRPLKVRRTGFAADGAAEGANVISGTYANGQPIIQVSAGHGFVGADPGKLDEAQLDDLTRTVHEAARQYFPRKYERALAQGLLRPPYRYCIRPWTPSGLGLFETVPGAGGGLTIVTGGHNTGGFAQSPSVGQAVVAALAGREHPMHTLYHPDRYASFYGSGGTAAESEPFLLPSRARSEGPSAGREEADPEGAYGSADLVGAS